MDRAYLDPTTSWMRLALLASAVGAGVLGFGAGLLLGDTLPNLGWPTVIVGLLVHAWGMTERHRIDAEQTLPAWSTAVYWLSWALLAVLAMVMVVRLVAG